MCPDRIREEVEALVKAGEPVQLAQVDGQCYAAVGKVQAPAPPWGSATHEILIAIPAAYDNAGMDGFYLRLPYVFNGGTHPKVNGQTIQFDGASWQLVSWHYPTGKPWLAGQDDLSSHILHCKGFFYHRGAINEYR